MSELDPMPVVAIVQARMSSTRLPGKVMKEISGRPMLWHVLNRLRASKLIDRIVVATSTDPSDDPIYCRCFEYNTLCFRGSLTDVLSRYYWAARAYRAGTIVRITADCPLIDPQVVDRVIVEFLSGKFDYVRTDESYPNGLDVEVFSFKALLKAFNEASLASEREHVTPYIWKNPEKFRISKVPCYEDLSKARWTVDDSRDLKLVRSIFKGLYDEKEVLFHMEEILDFLARNPRLTRINAGTRRNEGYAKSLCEDHRVKVG